MREILFLCCSFLFINCTAPKKYIDLTSYPLKAKNIRLDIKSLENWQHKDIIEDTIPGISLDKAYRELLKNKKGNKILVAVIDTSTDINHEDLKEIIWVNSDEIPNNDIDDDGNGYIDDVHGWNFIGNQKGENILYCNLESSRIIKHFKNKFEGKKGENIAIADQKNFIKYQNALLEYKKSYNVIMEEKKYGDSIRAGYKHAEKLLQPFFKNNQYTVRQLDSLALIHKEDIEGAIFFMKNYITQQISTENVFNYFQIIDDQIKTIYNENYNDRIIIGDNPDDLSDIKYGNNNVSILAKELQHGTKIAGVIGAARNNSIGINGIYNNLELMILPIAAYCNENDKDVALAIRYAVDNGAKVINMSFGKNISLREEWVRDAIVYAEEHHVLMVSGAGNDSVNLDVNPYFPTDVDEDGREISSNFIKVGSVSYYTKEWFVSYFSNYGKKM
ncbi:hypothetical protein FK004_03230 [Flavobacterium kingsejongi]|uniref:Peptidase S8/S53 domain-containing protein n=1 Tax=Flavobacterium kingsejongi TaxID=1678728 RepID=A0A2S1LL99_9FLAO|nr:hypothetical protein FK004_03230 [Flavobacterium kingsejongi]